MCFGAGWALSPRATDDASQEAKKPRATDGTLISDAQAAGGRGAGASKNARESGAGGKKSWQQSYESFSSNLDPLERLRRLNAALAAITAANWEEAWAPMWASRRAGQISEEEWKLFLQRFGAVGREKLAEKGRPADVVNDWETDNTRICIAGWAAEDVEGSLSYLSALPEGKYRRGLMVGWFEAAAAVAPEKAFSELAKLNPQENGDLWRTVAGKVAVHDPAQVRGWLESLSGQAASGGGTAGSELASSFFREMMNSRMRINPGDPAYVDTMKSWFDSYATSPVVPTGAMAAVSSALQQSQPAPTVLQWIGSHEGGAATFNAASNAVSRWTNERTTGEVAAWLTANKDSAAYDGAAAGFATRSYALDPEGARAWAGTIKNPQQREAVLQGFDEMDQKAVDAPR